MTPHKRAKLFFAVLIPLSLIVLWLSGGLGSHEGRVVFDPLWPQRLWPTTNGSHGAAQHLQHTLLVSWRMPRVTAGVIVGAALALAGLLLQSVTRNPLADPFLLGVSGGAGLAVVLTHALLPNTAATAWWVVPIAAFGGAIAATLGVLAIARGAGGRISVLGMILAGVVVNALCAALMAFLLTRFDPFRLRITRTWLAGGVGFTHWHMLIGAAGILAAVMVWARAQAHRLNAFSLGTRGAAVVGVDAERLLQASAALASLLAALGVSLAGMIGYVGLIVPHAVRMVVGGNLRIALPANAIAGAALLVGADAAARTLWAPEELPVGVLTALLGCPVLLAQLRAQLAGRQ